MLPLAEYGLEGGTVTPLQGGTINQVYRVESASGVFVLKQYAHSTLDRDGLERVVAAQELARKAGLPVPETVPTPAGQAFVQKDGHFYVLSRFVEGRLYPPGTMPSRAARRMGEMHARLLDALFGPAARRCAASARADVDRRASATSPVHR